MIVRTCYKTTPSFFITNAYIAYTVEADTSVPKKCTIAKEPPVTLNFCCRLVYNYLGLNDSCVQTVYTWSITEDRSILHVTGVACHAIIKQIINVVVMRPVENTDESQRLLAHTVTRWLQADMVPWLMRSRRCTLQIAANHGCTTRSMDEEKLFGRDFKDGPVACDDFPTTWRSSATPAVRTRLWEHWSWGGVTYWTNFRPVAFATRYGNMAGTCSWNTFRFTFLWKNWLGSNFNGHERCLVLVSLEMDRVEVLHFFIWFLGNFR